LCINKGDVSFLWFFSNLVEEEGSRIQGIKGSSDSKRFYADGVYIGVSSALFLDHYKNIFLLGSGPKNQGIIFIYLFLKLFTRIIESLDPYRSTNSLGDDSFFLNFQSG